MSETAPVPKKPLTKRSASAAMAAPGPPPSRQVAALCFRRTGKGLRVLLITSRDTGRWVIPKGWPMRNRSDAEAAAREAFEEAGVRGTITRRSVGHYTYPKKLANGRFLPCLVQVFALEVREMVKVYPETGQRRAKWFTPKKAAPKVLEPELGHLIRSFKDPGDTDAG